MEASPKIIEFFGIPACGKSTIVEYLLKMQHNKNVVSYASLSKDFLHASVIKKIHSIPWGDIIQTLRLAKHVKSKRNNYYFERLFPLWKILICYKFAQRYSRYDLIYVDHGLSQSLISLIGGSELTSDLAFYSIAKSFLFRQNNIQYVYCHVDIDTALSRLQNRGPHKGRFNKDNDILILKKEYKQEILRFDKLSIICPNCMHVENNNNVSDVVEKYQLI